MTRTTLSFFVLFAAVALLPGAAAAISVSLDADPTTPGVQSFLAVDVSDEFTVDVVIQDVVLPESVTGFVFTVGFDSAVLTATDVRSGGYLPGGIPIVSLAGGHGALHIELTFDPVGGVGDGVLASIDFAPVTAGKTGVHLTHLKLAQGWHKLEVDSVSGIDVAASGARPGSGNAPVPEPTAAMLFAAGLLVVRSGLRRS